MKENEEEYSQTIENNQGNNPTLILRPQIPRTIIQRFHKIKAQTEWTIQISYFQTCKAKAITKSSQTTSKRQGSQIG
uniref:Uncharacterized protein n=1 Tax=Cucumis melo TaxID=3656 RepID=A0A9I9EAY4_CUCME